MKRHRHQRNVPVLLIAAIALFFPLPAPAAGIGFTISALPQMPPVAMHANWAPFVEQLARESGVALELKLYESMDEFERDVVKGEPDFAYLHSAEVVAAKLKQGYIPIVRNDRPVAGVFVVRKDSPIRTLRDLEGKTVAFVGKQNLCRLLLDHVLVDEQSIRVRAVYAGTTANMLKHVILAKADAGGALDVSIEKLPPNLLARVRVLYTTRPIAPHALAAHPRVPARVRAAVADAIIRMGSREGDRALLKKVQFDHPVRADYDRDYKMLEHLDIERYFGTGGE